MHSFQPQPLRPPSLPWRTTPRDQVIAAFGAADRPVQQWIWHSRFGPIFIEVRGKDVFVNGDRVAPHAP